MPSPTDDPTPSRRAVLAGLAGLSTGAAGLAARPARADTAATVVTWNAYLGVDLFDLFDARSIEDVRTIAGDLLADARRHPYAARADAIAAGIGAADADAVALRPDERGDTCCQPSRLQNDRSRLSRRVDALLSSGGAEPTAVDRLGEDPSDRVPATVEGEAVTVWPSDHAGVAATFSLPAATAGPTPSPTPPSTATPLPTGTTVDEPTTGVTDADATTATPSGTAPAETTDATGSGFGPLATVAALVGGTLARNRD
jgi:hypothetical protein